MATNIVTDGHYGHIGDGVPTFVAPKGGTFLDLLAPSIYQSNGDGSWVNYGIINSDNFYTTGTTFSNNIVYFNRNDSLSAYTVNLSGLSTTDTYVSATTFNAGNYELTLHRNDATNLTESLAILASDMVVTGGTYNVGTGIVTYTNNSGGTFNISGFTSGMTDSYTTGVSVSGDTKLTFDNNILGNNYYNVDLASLSLGLTTAFTYNNNINTFTINNNDGTSYGALINSMTGLTINGDLNVLGDSFFSGSGTDVLTVVGSGTGSTNPIFAVHGDSGELFTVTDSLDGILFSVNNDATTPIFQVNSDNTILLGDNNAPALYTTTILTATTGTTNIYTLQMSAYTGGFFDYTVNDGTNLRAGNIVSIFSGTNITYNETSTTDIGDTSDITFDMIISGNTSILTTSATTSSWTVKTIIKSI